jgi:hypothetical protein
MARAAGSPRRRRRRWRCSGRATTPSAGWRAQALDAIDNIARHAEQRYREGLDDDFLRLLCDWAARARGQRALGQVGDPATDQPLEDIPRASVKATGDMRLDGKGSRLSPSRAQVGISEGRQPLGFAVTARPFKAVSTRLLDTLLAP